MTDRSKTYLSRALRLALRPVVHLLLRGGMSWKEAAELLKITFVEVATEEYGLHGRPTNISRVAILTGLSRREAGRLRKLLAEETEPEFEGMNRATRVLTGWHLDPDFLDDAGRPRDLPLDGSAPSFAELAQRYGGDIAAVTLARELARHGAVAELDNGRLQVRKRYFMPSPLDPMAMLRAGAVLRDLGNTVAYNLDREDGAATRFEGRATNVQMRTKDAKAFRAFLEREGQGFLERIDEWLSVHEATTAERQRYPMRRFGVGIYQIHDDHGEDIDREY
jgi:hypothetical protein